jgi:hypothetical protein
LAGALCSAKSALKHPLFVKKQTLDNEKIPSGPFWLCCELAQLQCHAKTETHNSEGVRLFFP